MICKNCGTENGEGVRFCKTCGNPITEGGNPELNGIGNSPADNVNVGGGTNSTSSMQKKDLSNIIEKLKTIPKMVVVGATAAVVVLILIICVAVTSGKTIKLDKYLTIEAEGYDGYGTANVSIDWDAVEEKYGSKLKFTGAAKKEFGGFLGLMSPVDAIQDSVSVQLDKREGLSNGDVVTYTWSVDENLSKYVNCKVKFKDGDFTVSDLTEVGTFDAFDDLTVEFSGIAPYGTVSINYTGDEFSSYDFSCDKTSGLGNDDVVTVTLNIRDMSYYAENYGKVPENVTKTYTVSGLQEYAESYDKLTDDFIAELKSETEDSIYAYTASDYSGSSSLTDLNYVGYIMNMAKESSYYSGNVNNLYIIYSGTVSNSEGEFGTTKVYFPVQFKNIMIGDEITYEQNCGIVGYSNIDGTWYSTKGYVNPIICYMEIVETNRDSYTSECGDGFEEYSEYETIEKIDDISESYRKTLYDDARDKIESYIANDYSSDLNASNLSVAGEYMLLAKTQGTDFENNNKYFVVFSATVSHSDGDFEATTVYFPVEYDGIVKLPGDEYMTTVNGDILGNSTFADTWYHTKGYIDGTQMYSDIITSNRANYTYEVSDSLKEFGQ